MPIFAVISEYNPFTLGHEYHINAARRECGADYIVGIMSGPFVQRGEPAVMDKFTRAAIAVSCGLDAVIELPCIYAVSNAEQFARGGVRTAAAMGVDGICCGCEHTDAGVISFLADVSADEPEELSLAIKEGLMRGCSYASVRAEEYAKWASRSSIYSYDYVIAVMTQPNSILALEYKKAINVFAPHMELKLIQRVGGGYNDKCTDASFPSASAVRETILCGRAIREYVPSACAELLERQMQTGNAPVTLKSLEQAILYRIRTMTCDELDGLYDCPPGLGRLIRNAAAASSCIHEAVSMCVNKSFTAARIRRIFIAALLGQTKELAEKCRNTDIPLHVLGARDSGVLSVLSAKSRSQIITRANQFPEDNAIFTFDIKAANIYSLALAPENRAAMRDYTQKLELFKS